MASKLYERCFKAIREKKRLTFVYDGEPRDVCPHVLGHTNAAEKLFAYQVAGGSTQGKLPPEGDWRCFFVSGIEQLRAKPGPWKTAGKHTRRHSCVAEVYIDVNPKAQQKFSWESN